MADCDNIPTLQTVQDFNTDAKVLTEVVTSDSERTVLADSQGVTHKTLTGLNQLFGGINVGDYVNGTVLNEVWEYAYNPTTGYGYKVKSKSSLPYPIDATTYPDPEDDPNLKRVNEVNKEQVNDLIANSFNADIHIESLGIVNGSDSDSRSTIYGSGLSVYVPKDFTFRCNILPNDDVTIFKGLGSFVSLDPWGNEHIFDIKKANDGDGHTTQSRIRSKALIGETPTIGFIGDSITDGADSTGWSANPVDGSGNLNSTNYNHDQVGAVNGYVNIFRQFSYAVLGLPNVGGVETFNASSAGKALYTEWAYRNIDYGFFQNDAYQNTVPDVVFLVMGHNDSIVSEAAVEKYLSEFDKFIRKARGYGAAVGLISVSRNAVDNGQKETFKEAVKARYGVDYFDLASEIVKYSRNGAATLKDLYYDGPSSSDYDFTHPNDAGHKFMGLELIGQIFPDRVIDLNNDGGYTPLRTAKQITYQIGGSLQNVTTTEDLTGQDYLDEVEGLTSFTSTSGGVVHAFVVRVSKPLQKIAVIIPKPPTGNSSYTIEVNNADKSSSDNVYSSGAGAIDGYYSISVENADFGINIIRIIAQGTVVESFVPFIAPVSNKNIESISINRNVLANASLQKLTGVNYDKAFNIRDYSTMPYGATPDRVIGVSQSSRVQVAIPAIVGLRFWFARKHDITASNGFYVVLSSATQLDIVDGETFVVVSSITGLSLSGRLVFDIVYTGNSFVIQCQGNQSAPSLVRRGGILQVENQSGSNIFDLEGSVTVSKDIIK